MQNEMDEFLILSFLIYAAPTIVQPLVDEAVVCVARYISHYF